jgi:hypothetical protein
MRHVTTEISETHVRLRYAGDDPDEWCEFQVPLKGLGLLDHDKDHDLGNIEKRPIARLREAAIVYLLEKIRQENFSDFLKGQRIARSG